jgi:hypothetical protein
LRELTARFYLTFRKRKKKEKGRRQSFLHCTQIPGPENPIFFPAGSSLLFYWVQTDLKKKKEKVYKDLYITRGFYISIAFNPSTLVAHFNFDCFYSDLKKIKRRIVSSYCV